MNSYEDYEDKKSRLERGGNRRKPGGGSDFILVVSEPYTRMLSDGGWEKQNSCTERVTLCNRLTIAYEDVRFWKV